MIIEIGHFAFVLFLMLHIVSLLFFGRILQKVDNFSLVFQKKITFWQFGLLSFSFCSLLFSYAISDFSVLSVVNSSYSEKPLFYKLTAFWSTQEGSLFLWIFLAQGFFLAFSHFSKINQKNLSFEEKKFIKFVYLWQNFTLFGFSIFIYFFANPFLRSLPDVIQGKGLNPLLQDVALAIHPPILYLGYSGFSLCFSITMAGLLQNKIDREWSLCLKKWTLISLFFLTLGITIGACWAYYELGWGGYWSFDPVENLSLLPWFSAISLIHTLKILEKKSIFQKINIFLSILTFLLTLIGFLFIRSGFLNSVHSFAIDTRKGLGLFLLIIYMTLPSFALFFYHKKRKEKDLELPYSTKDIFFLIAIFSLFFMNIVLLIGTIYPMVYQFIYQKPLTIDLSFFSYGLSFPAMFASIFFGVFVLSSRYLITLSFLISILSFFYFYQKSEQILFSVLFSLGTFISCILFISLFLKFKNHSLSKSFIAGFLSHIGVAIFFFSISINGAFLEKNQYILEIGDDIFLKDYTLHFDKVVWKNFGNYTEKQLIFQFFKTTDQKRKNFEILKPAFRFFSLQNLKTSEAALLSKNLSQIYLVPVDEKNNKYIVTLYWQEKIWFFIFAIFLILLGYILSLSIKNKKK